MGRLLPVRTPLLAAIVLLVVATNLRAEEFPFAVYAAEHGVVVRGGPGEAYYATQELKRGEELVVYRIEQGEWYAVRPPGGSYSLVSANAVADQGDGYGEVVRNGAASRIGSSLVDLHDTVHVRLEQGERVRILGSQTKSGMKWLRIQPPHGEFRWVHKDEVVVAPPPEPTSPIQLDELEPAPTVMPLTHNGGDRYTAPPLAGESLHDWEAREEMSKPLPAGIATDSDTSPQPLAGRSQADTIPSANPQEPLASEPLKPAAEPVPLPQAATSTPDNETSPTAGDAFTRRLFVLEMELGRMVAEAPNLWNLGSLEREASRLMTSASAEAEREAVRQFAGRLERFASIRRRYETLPSVDALLAARAPSTTPATGSIPSTIAESVNDAANASGNDSRFDAIGLLRPVASTRADAPKFALVNDAGQIVTFVTPAPDVNLQAYVGRRVGVSGTRGYMAEYNQRHVTAGRVMPVGDRLVR